jgi:pyridoxal phosphate enzyme (YggS family)
MARACRDAGREPSEVELIAVGKTHGPDALRRAVAAGQQHLGENYAQELRDKATLMSGVHWHYIGRIQTNKARYIAPYAHRIHALTERRHAEALAARRPGQAPLACMVSVHTGGEASKGGVAPADCLARCRELSQVPGIEIVGLMTLPPFYADPDRVGPHFEQVAELAELGRRQGLRLTELSMGMTHDFEVAIRYGATWLRIGTAIFGPRGDRPWRQTDPA